MSPVGGGAICSPPTLRSDAPGPGAGQCRPVRLTARAGQQGRERERVPHRYRSRSGLHPSHGLRVYSVVLAMGAEEPDCHRSRPILEGRDQSVIVALDVEDDPAGLENANLGIPCFPVLLVAPFAAAYNVDPRFELRSCRFDPLMASELGEIAFDQP